MKHLKLFEEFNYKNINTLQDEIDNLYDKMKLINTDIQEKEQELDNLKYEIKNTIKKFIDTYSNKYYNNYVIELNLKIVGDILKLDDSVNSNINNCNIIERLTKEENSYFAYFSKDGKNPYCVKIERLNPKILYFILEYINKEYPEFNNMNQFGMFENFKLNENTNLENIISIDNELKKIKKRFTRKRKFY